MVSRISIFRPSFIYPFSTSLFGKNLGLSNQSQKRLLLGCSSGSQYGKKFSVSDLRAWEWCEKQFEYDRQFAKYKRPTKAMKRGTARHKKLEEEVSKKVVVRKLSAEDAWAAKFMNFLICVNQLSLEGLTRELPLVSLVNGKWFVGVIDELRMPIVGTVQNPSLVDTKTRNQATLPSEPQKRNSRLQLMCYKYLWDTTISTNFPIDEFFNSLGLDPQYNLPKEIQDRATNLGFHAKTLGDLVMFFQSTCSTLSPSQDELLLRYEYQVDNSLLGEETFAYDSDSFQSLMKNFLEFVGGQRDASYVSKDENWKCRICSYASVCPSCTKTHNIRKQ
ncbi:exonuclease V, chloroplastic-like isoform X1 [Papaver somniferum]|uniref:exonuclease V, chloroplastic-like isoform X1 n=1 Tax=Papaver somniferum TaxID=3469 RepID=UPI000E70354D|nr:exonuclease V, chloroplastic-like isoform X1 [Papaver somniferum]